MSDPFIYCGTNKAKFAQRIPPDVRAQCLEFPCERCQQAALFTPWTLGRARAAAALANRELILVCNCCESPGHAGRIEVCVENLEATEKFRRYEAEQN